MITAVTIWLVWHKFFPKICNTDHPKTATKAKKKEKRKEWSRREGLKQACEGFLMAQISFCKRYLLESDTEGLRFYFFLSFFFKTVLLGSCKSWTESMKSGSLKKAQNLSKVAKKWLTWRSREYWLTCHLSQTSFSSFFFSYSFKN